MEGYHVIEIPEKEHTLYLPKELAYCDTRQYVEFNTLLFQYHLGVISYEELRLQAVYKLLNLQKSKNKLNQIEEDYKNSNIYLLSELIDSFFEINQGQASVKLNYVHNPMLVIKPLFTTYTGPDGLFKNVNFGRYEDALNLYSEYANHKDRNLLNMLLGTLYLPNYDPATIEKDSLQFDKIPVGYAYGAFNFLGAFQTYIVGSEVSWEGKNIRVSILFEDEAGNSFKSDIPGLGMKSIGYQLAETGVFGTYKEVRNTNLWEVILRLYDMRKRDRDAIKQQKEAESKNKK